MDRYLKGLLDRLSACWKFTADVFSSGSRSALRLQYGRKILGRMPESTAGSHPLGEHYTQGYGDGKDNPTKTIELLPGAVEEAEMFLMMTTLFASA